MLFPSYKRVMALCYPLFLFFWQASLWAGTHYVEIPLRERSFQRLTLPVSCDKVKFIICPMLNEHKREEIVIKGKKTKTETWESGELGYEGTFTYSVHEGTI